jgi:methionine synthase II (cobalamin-independent)
MATRFQANCLPVLIGSLPLQDHHEALELVLRFTPEIPLWVQLPFYRHEGMVPQFTPGLPGLTGQAEKMRVDTSQSGFASELIAFYEDYLAVTDGGAFMAESRFALKPENAAGFFVLLERIASLPNPPLALKGQVTGPITFSTAIKDQNERALFYDVQLREVAVKLLAMKARWQVERLARFELPVIIFIDEPGLAGFGSSEFISITRDEVRACLDEVVQAIHAAGGLVGVHVCANTDWSLLLESEVDMVNFDAYSYFDRFVLYPEQINHFIKSGGVLAWGIVPTQNTADIERETVSSLVAQWHQKAAVLEALGVERSALRAQSLLTPSCGTGSLSLDHARRVLKLTHEIAKTLRSENRFS